MKLEGDVNREEATMRLKQSEIKSLQNEAETLQQMIKQLDVQKGEARKRLDDLGSQVYTNFIKVAVYFAMHVLFDCTFRFWFLCTNVFWFFNRIRC